MAQTTLPSLFSDLDRMAAFGGMRREFDDLLGRFGMAGALMPLPAIDVVRGEKAITVTADLPGMAPEAIDVSVRGDALHIAGETSEEDERKGGDVVLSERRRGAFSRTIPLGFEPGEDAIETKLAHGVLTITVAVPPAAAPKARKVEIKAG
jgi:HSP20 family protein